MSPTRSTPTCSLYAAGTGELLGQVGQRGLYIGNMVRPKGVSVDSDGNIYVVESYYDHLLVYDAAGQFLLPVGGTGYRHRGVLFARRVVV